MTRRVAVMLLAVASAALPLARATGAPPSTSASASAAPMPLGRLPPIDSSALGNGESKQPSAAEWRAANEVAPTRRSTRAAPCRVFQSKEWLRIRCDGIVAASWSALGGDSRAANFWIDAPKKDAEEKLPGAGELVFPLRPGARVVFQLMTFGQGYEGPFTQLPAVVIQAHFVDNEPVLTLW